MRLRYSFLAFAALLLSVAPSAQTATAALSGANEVPPVQTAATGSVSVVVFPGAAAAPDTVIVGGSFSGLESDYNASIGSHLHGGAAGANGPVRYSLTPTLGSDNRSGTFNPSQNRIAVRKTFADSLRSGLVYVNIHTVDNASGEIRGQLRVATPVAAGALVINELLADPAPDGPGDANGDGTRESSEDEFIEIANTTGANINISGFVIEDAASAGNSDPAFIRHLFPAGSVVPANGAIVVFGGGVPTGAFGGVTVQTAQNPTTTFSPQLGLNNSNETITLATSVITGGTATGTTVDEFAYGTSVMDESYARNPDLTGAFVAQSSIQTGVLFTPGLKNVDGSTFNVSTANEPEALDAGLTIRVANPLTGSATVRYAVGSAGTARLEAFDLLGRRVALLAEGSVSGEVQTATFDAGALPAGIYVLRLTGDAGVVTRTVTVVR